MNPFEMSPDRLRRIGGTRPAQPDAALLAAGLHSRRLILLKSLLTRAERTELAGGSEEALHTHWALLEAAEAHDPEAARHALGCPAVGNWLAHVLAAPDRGPGGFAAELAGLGGVAAAVALRTGLDFRLTLPPVDGLVALPGIGSYTTRAPQLHLEGGPGTLTLIPEGSAGRTVVSRTEPPARAAGWRALRPLPGSAAVLDDHDPVFAREGGAAGLTPRAVRTEGEARHWAELWTRALELLRAADPERAVEVSTLVRSLVPVLWKPSGRASATRLAAPWAVLTTLPGSPEEMAEVLVHEVQHSKLAVLSDLVRLHEDTGDALFRVGWRADPRPLGAVLQGTYAHLALADLWERIAGRPGAGAAERRTARGHREKYAAQVADALSLLRGSGQLTLEGREFVEGMCRHRPGRPAGRPGAGAPVTDGHYG